MTVVRHADLRKGARFTHRDTGRTATVVSRRSYRPDPRTFGGGLTLVAYQWDGAPDTTGFMHASDFLNDFERAVSAEGAVVS